MKHQIELKNIRIYSNHGCMIEESKIGSEYLINLLVDVNLEKPSFSDKLEDTVNYVVLNKIVAEEMLIRSELLEHVAQRIMTRIQKEIQEIKKIKLKICKINPPINGNIEKVCVIFNY
jgi:dihydroneopterin aldolase